MFLFLFYNYRAWNSLLVTYVCISSIIFSENSDNSLSLLYCIKSEIIGPEMLTLQKAYKAIINVTLSFWSDTIPRSNVKSWGVLRCNSNFLLQIAAAVLLFPNLHHLLNPTTATCLNESRQRAVRRSKCLRKWRE